MIAEGVLIEELFSLDRLEEYRYIDFNDGVKIVGYSGLKEYIEIPEEIDGKKVVAIGLNEEGYPGSMGFKILIPNTVTYIDPKTNPTCYGSWYREFYFKSDNPHFIIEDNFLFSKDKKTLYFCFDEELENLVIPESVECIGAYAFYKQRFDNIKLPSNLKRIEAHAFAGSYMILKLPVSVEYIGPQISYGYELAEGNSCYKKVGNCIYTMDGKTLVQCVEGSVVEIQIPDEVEEIFPYAFANVRIAKLELGTGIKRIGDSAFERAVIKTIRIPSQVEYISEKAFGYEKCSSIRVEKGNKNYSSDGTCFFSFNEDGSKRLLKCYKNKTTEYEVPEGVTSIANGAFAECINLTKLVLPEGLLVFDEACLKTKSTYGGNKCGIKGVEIPASVETLHVNCRNWKYKIHKENPHYFVEKKILYHRCEDGLEIVSSEKVSGELVIREDVVRILPRAFEENNLTKVVCPSSLKEIAYQAFSTPYGKTKIEEVILNEGLESIDYLAFTGSELKTLVIPASLRYMCVSAFHKCESLEYEVSMENQNYSSENGVLYNKAKSEMLVVPKKKQYSRFEVPETVMEIGRAFRYCKGIDEIVLPSGVKYIWRDSLKCSANDIYFQSDIKYFNYTGADFFKPVKLHADAGTGVVQYVKYLKSIRGDVKMKLSVNGEEDISALSSEYDLMKNDTGLTIVRVLKEKAVMEIPEKFGDYPVTEIASRAFEGYFSNNDIIEEVVIPDTVTKIGDFTFRYRSHNLKKVVLPSGIKKIPKGMFLSCARIEEIVVPDGVEIIEESAFFGCEDVKKIVIPASVKEISSDFLADEDGKYKDLYARPFTVYVVEKGSYAEEFLRNYEPYVPDCKLLNVVYKGQDTVEYMGTAGVFAQEVLEDGTVKVSMVYENNYEEKQVTTPTVLGGKSVRVLDFSKHSIGRSVKEFTISKSIEKVIFGNYVLAEELEKLHVHPENPYFATDGKVLFSADMTVLYKAFCSDLKQYNIPEGVKVIEESAFSKCNDLENLVLPSTIEEIKKYAFLDCSKLEKIEGIEHASNVHEKAMQGTLYEKNLDVVIVGTTLAKYKNTDETRYVVPEGIETIGEGAFYLYNKEDALEEIVLPKSLKTIQAKAFSGRTHLKKINIPEGVVSIGNLAFETCYELEALELPASITTIGENVFPVHKPGEKLWNRIESPVYTVFTGVTVDEKNEHYLSENQVLYSKDKSILYYVPDNYAEKEFVVPESVKTIKKYAFFYNRFIETITFEGVIESFEDSCFYGCESLLKIIFCDKQEHIATAVPGKDGYSQGGIFANCSKLSKVQLPQHLKEIGEKAFYKCAMKEIVLPQSLIRIGNSAFEGNQITDVVLPKSVEIIGGNIFAGALKTVTIYDTIEADVTECPVPRFAGEDVKWPSNVSRIGIPDFVIGSRGHDTSQWGSFTVIVKSAETDTEKYRVKMPSDGNWMEFYTYAMAWANHARFDFNKIDAEFGTLKENKLDYAVERLRHLEELSEMVKETFVKYLVRNAKPFVKNCIDTNDLESIKYFDQFGIIKKANFEELSKYAKSKKKKVIEDYLSSHPAAGKKAKPQIPGYKAVAEGKFDVPGVMDLTTSDLYYGEFRFRGLVEEIDRLTTFLLENKIDHYEEIELENGISEVRVWASDATTVLIQEFPLLKATGLCEEWGSSMVKVMYSESGYSVLTDCKDAGYFDKRHDGGNGRWALECDMMEKVNVNFTWLQTGEKQKVSYTYPYKAKWNKDNFVIEKDGVYYTKVAKKA